MTIGGIKVEHQVKISIAVAIYFILACVMFLLKVEALWLPVIAADIYLTVICFHLLIGTINCEVIKKFTGYMLCMLYAMVIAWFYLVLIAVPFGNLGGEGWLIVTGMIGAGGGFILFWILLLRGLYLLSNEFDKLKVETTKKFPDSASIC